MTRPRVLIEDWLPIQELGIESRREREVASALPPINFLHVWWARRPLVASAGTLLASILPTWSPGLADAFPGEKALSSEAEYKRWFLGLCGIFGDAVAGAAKVQAAKAQGGKRPPDRDLFGYDRAYTARPNSTALLLLRAVLKQTWGSVSVIDPTAGGGSIPLTASRYGLSSLANDLNSVAAAVLRAGVVVPAQFGLDLVPDLRQWGEVLVERVAARLGGSFDRASSTEQIQGYIFARSVACPRTGKLVPLAPNWWVCKESGKLVAARLVTSRKGVELDGPEFEILHGQEAVASDPDSGTVARGQGVSPWDGLSIDSDYIKQEAQQGRMGSILYAVSIRTRPDAGARAVRGFRSPDATDLNAIAAAEAMLSEVLPGWIDAEVVPAESVPVGNDTRPIQYGMSDWRDMFSPRQLLVHGVFVEEFQRMIPEVRAEMSVERADALLGLLGLMQGKALNYNSYLSSWHAPRGVMRSVFERHDFAFKWTYAEFDGAKSLYPWALEQLVDSYTGIASLVMPQDVKSRPLDELDWRVPSEVVISRGTAGNLAHVEDNSQTLVCIDPPYYDNVMYGELSDYFGVWEQHTVGRVWPDLMPGGLADLKNEAVANPARFVDAGSKRKTLADADYEAKMGAIFTESHRILREDGVMTVMFTHKKAEAWDTLGMALMEAGFTIETSWPVNTESEQSLHQARMNSAASTIMLVCRKRTVYSSSSPFFEDLEADVRRAARDAVEQFTAAGIDGVDLLLSTYGPALSVISDQWPVYSSEADVSGKARLLRPEEALSAAREEVVRLQRRALIGRSVDLDPTTDFALLAWATFKAVEFPFDEARRLALAVGGLDVDELAASKVLVKKAGTVALLEPKQRLRRRGDDKPGVRPDAESFGVPVIDAVHTVLYVAAEDGLADAKALIDRAGLANDNRFLACVQGLVNAIPRTKDKGKWVRPEAGLLDALVTAYFPDIEVPEEWTGTLDLGSA